MMVLVPPPCEQASSGKLLRKHGYFDLLGCDFMLSATNQLFLLEVNTNPALSLDNSTLEQLLPGTYIHVHTYIRTYMHTVHTYIHT